ncbi:cytochrome P450 [Phenylobacterium sp. LjRoot225]|uniref:cytochrome P450 n=1 Tax=Phenylobacterium sp. LjRoot225 TaxID=3342285 RepID=UPI003ECD6714
MNDVSAFAPRPAHIPDAAVYDFDMFRDSALLADPHERVRQLLREAPAVFWTPRNRGHWVALGHEPVFEVSREFDRFSSEFMAREQMQQMLAMAPPGMPYIPQSKPISLDPPDHAKYRAPLASVFGPKAIKARTDEIRALANALIDEVAGQGCCDFMPSVAEPLPVQVFLKMMGLPLERQAEFRRMVHEFLGPGMNEPMQAASRMRMIADAIDEVILARKDDRRDDLISLLWAAEIDGKPMTLETMEDFAVLLFIAGLDTVINGMGFGVRHMAANPDFQARLRADPSLIPEAVEELLRRYTFTVPTRRVAKDTELGGWTLKKDEWVMIYLPAADLDPSVFPAPEVFDLDRENKTHIAFGAGSHRCLGSHLARLELQVLYTELLTRLPTFRLDPDKPVTFHAGNIIAMDSLPLRWD